MTVVVNRYRIISSISVLLLFAGLTNAAQTATQPFLGVTLYHESKTAPRLQAIADWFDDTQREGGYRPYYGKDPKRGSLQGGGTAGGLGLDCEFTESVMATQVMLYGILGMHPTVDGFSIAPKLPSDWPELTITRIHLRDQVLNVTATRKGELKIVAAGPSTRELVVHAREGTTLESVSGVKVRIVKEQSGE